MPNKISHLRRHYEGEPLNERSVMRDPFLQFDCWLGEAFDAGVPDPNAMVLATCDGAARPSLRTVLLKAVDGTGFSFYTNYQSRKGAELLKNPQASVLFFWPQLHRQVRISGTVSKTSRVGAEAYFGERPRESRLAALASAQSTVLESREALMARYAEVEAAYAGKEIPCPDYWGGYCLKPESFEFWQGQPNRLHDRLLYAFNASTSAWSLCRLAP